MSEHTEWNQNGTLVYEGAKLVASAEWAHFSGTEAIEHTAQIVKEHNAYPKLLTACDVWMKFAKELAYNTPVPDYTLRIRYAKEAEKLTKAAIDGARK